MSRTPTNKLDQAKLESAAENLKSMLSRIRPFVRRPKREDPDPKQPWRSSTEAADEIHQRAPKA